VLREIWRRAEREHDAFRGPSPRGGCRGFRPPRAAACAGRRPLRLRSGPGHRPRGGDPFHGQGAAPRRGGGPGAPALRPGGPHPLYPPRPRPAPEGGDLLWLDRHTLAAGLGFRTNAAGSPSSARRSPRRGFSVLPVELPYHTGPEACLHLLSLLSLVDHDLAVAYLPLLPVPSAAAARARHPPD